MTGDHLEYEVKRFLAEFHAERIERLTLESRLLHDLGMDGADGWEFMEAFGKRFGVNISEFRPGLHFGPEGAGCNPIAVVLMLLDSRRRYRFIPITVGDLVEAARSKHWRTPDREAVP